MAAALSGAAGDEGAYNSIVDGFLAAKDDSSCAAPPHPLARPHVLS